MGQVTLEQSYIGRQALVQDPTEGSAAVRAGRRADEAMGSGAIVFLSAENLLDVRATTSRSGGARSGRAVDG